MSILTALIRAWKRPGMAKAQFNRNQRVWVESVGAWGIVERIIPVWAKGFDEPVRITYDVGFGREFQSAELQAEAPNEGVTANGKAEPGWRVMRTRNKWQQPEDCAHHPFPGTFPVIVTDEQDWGGWRVPGAEYDRDPQRYERQARLIACAPQLARLAQSLNTLVSEHQDDAPPAVVAIGNEAARLLRFISGERQTGASPSAMAAE